MGFRSPPFLLFLVPLPFAALFAAVATCLALLMAAFLISMPFILWRKICVGGCQRITGGNAAFQVFLLVAHKLPDCVYLNHSVSLSDRYRLSDSIYLHWTEDKRVTYREGQDKAVMLVDQGLDTDRNI